MNIKANQESIAAEYQTVYVVKRLFLDKLT